MFEELLQLSKTLKSRGFQVFVCEDKTEATELIMKMISDCTSLHSIGFGNSATSRALGLQENLQQYTQNIYVHIPQVDTEDADKKALTSDFYFTSVNAISMDGHIVNIDGTGNRTAATCFGPGRVIYLIGKNKITKTLDEAILRAKNTAVQLAKKYNRKTPCVVTGRCEDCISPECICAITTIHRKKPYGINITVVLINEELGI